TERRVHVYDVVIAQTQNATQRLAQLEAPGESRLRTIGVNRLALADADDVRLRSGAGNVRRDDVDLVAEATRFAREEVDVLADTAEVRIVVLGHQCDAQRSCV